MTDNPEDDDSLGAVVEEFVIECGELLDNLNVELLALEADPQQPGRIAEAFRCLHTVKGSCGWLALSKMESLAHACETLLAEIRDNQLNVSSAIISVLLRASDEMRAALPEIKETHREGDRNYDALIAQLEQCLSSKAEPNAPTSVRSEGSPLEMIEADATTVRVSVSLLDDLVNRVGELVLARNQILQLASTSDNAALTVLAQRLNLVTSELQERIMKARMRPIGKLFRALPRVVRDTALLVGKQANLHIDGADTELDRSLLEAIRDPLTHLIRNAIDHGLESPELREQLGKPRAGQLSVRAYHEAGQVLIEVSDDGRGVDRERLRARLLQAGLVSEERLRMMDDAALLSCLFLSGLSTSERLTQISGRGVGLDVVKSNVEKVSGSVDVSSEPGVGTVFRLKIPLTLAIIPALVVMAHGQRYAIPQVNLVELVRLDEAEVLSRVEMAYGAPVFRSRERLLPLLYLSQLLQVQNHESHDGSLSIVVLDAEGRHFGLVVDSIQDTEEIVVKPLGPQLKSLMAYSGATIMGDGKVALILDILGIAQAARVGIVQDVRKAQQVEEVEPESHDSMVVTEPMLLVAAAGSRIAMPLADVDRLEVFAAANVESVGSRLCVQYRDEILNLVPLASILEERRSKPRNAALTTREDGLVEVVVHRREGKSVGFIVDQIIDTVSERFRVQPEGARRGVLGTAVIRGRIAEVLDMQLSSGVVHPSSGSTQSTSQEAQ